jgi:methionyl aminopeptidase
MSISSNQELEGIKKVSEAVATTLKEMKDHARPGMSAKQLDEFGRKILEQFGARSAPKLTYGFPGYTCISVNHEIAHGIPSAMKIFKEGDLVNIDVSAELNGYWSDNGGSFILGEDKHDHQSLVSTSKQILLAAISQIRGGVRIAAIGNFIETEAKKKGFTVIRNLVGHGVGKALHEEPFEIPCYFDRSNNKRFRKDSVVAIETFISTRATRALDKGDGWTFVTGDESFVAQHEHTILITDTEPVVLTWQNGFLN